MANPEEPNLYISEAFAKVFLEAPETCHRIMNSCLTREHLQHAAEHIAAGKINEQMPEYLEGFARDARAMREGREA